MSEKQRILWVNLSSKKIETKVLEENFFRQYTGNGILAAYYLLKNTTPGFDALSAENLLMFMSGAINGYEMPGLARFTVCGKSPLTGGIGESRCEGPFAIALKETGYIGIIIRGKLDRPGILVIENGVPRIEYAEACWGMTVSEVTDELQKQYVGAHVAAIGPAGENRVRFANIISDKCHQASRGGMGAVMGSKLLKAVVILGGQKPKAADPDTLAEIRESFRKRIFENPLTMWEYELPGFGVWIHTHGIDASVCVNNYQSATCDYLDSYLPEKFEKYYRGVAKCPGCPLDCLKMYAIDEKNASSSGLHQEISGSMGPNIGNNSVEVILRANVLCNEYGLDADAVGYVISFAQELNQRGILHIDDVDLSFSEKCDTLKLLEMIANRISIGNTLAEGAARAASIIGNGAEKYAMTVKGSELVPFEPRSQTNIALGYATSPLGPRFDYCEHDWDFDTRVGWPHTLNYCRTIGIRDRVPMEFLDESKVRNFKALSMMYSSVDALGVCLFSSAPTRVYSLRDISTLVAAITGWETSDYEVMRLGELRQTIYRVFNCREGLTAQDDMLPERFFTENIDFGMHEGVKLDKQKFVKCIKLYYEMMGWDEEGKPTKAKLYDLGIEWAHDCMKQ